METRRYTVRAGYTFADGDSSTVLTAPPELVRDTVIETVQPIMTRRYVRERFGPGEWVTEYRFPNGSKCAELHPGTRRGRCGFSTIEATRGEYYRAGFHYLNGTLIYRRVLRRYVRDCALGLRLRHCTVTRFDAMGNPLS